MEFIDKIIERAKADLKTIVLPEPEDIRVLKAAERIYNEKIAIPILVGHEVKVRELAHESGVNIENIRVINPENAVRLDDYANALYELRKDKGMTADYAKQLLMTNSRYFATMMVKCGDADGFVSGACHSTADTLKPALQIIKGAPGIKTVSAFFIMDLPDKTFGDDGVFIFADCGMNANPNAEQLSDIAIESAASFRELVDAEKEPKIAMLSYSTKGSASSELVDKVVNATNLVHEKAPELFVDGELQLDAAVVPEVAKSKAPNSNVAGNANILIFPDLDAGNIGYKLTQRFGHAKAYGPLCQGMAMPVNDLSRGCNSDDVVGVVAITCVQAQRKLDK